MSIEPKHYLRNSGTALVLHGERELIDAMAVSEHTRQRLSNAIDLSAMTFSTAMSFVLHSIQLGVRRFMLRVGDVRFAWNFRLPYRLALALRPDPDD